MQFTKRGWLYLGFVFGLSWALSGTAYAVGLRYGNNLPSLITAMAFMATPLLAALISWRLEGKGRDRLRDAIAFSFRMGWPAAIGAWLVFPLIGLATLGFTLLLPGFAYDPSMSDLIARFAQGLSPQQIEEIRRSLATAPLPPVLMNLLQGLAAGVTVNAVAGYGEESGWRGYLTRQLAGTPFWTAAAFTGVVWGAWHAPLIVQGHNYPEHPLIGVLMMTAWCVLLSPLMLYIRLRSKSAIAAAVAHGTLNGTAGVAIMGVKGGNDLTLGLTGLCGFAVLGAANLVLWVIDRRARHPVMGNRILASEPPPGQTA